MCNICNSLFGHSKSCPEDTSSITSTYCYSCERKLENGEKIAIFQNGEVFCKDCVNDLDILELSELLESENAFSMIEKFELCKTEKLGSY